MSREEKDQVVAAGWTGLMDWLWRALTRPSVTVILLVWLVVILALSIIVPQFPRHVEDPLVRSRWLAGFPTSAWALIQQLQTLGVFNLSGSIWLRLPLALLLAHALLMLASWGPAAWRCARQMQQLPSEALVDAEATGPGRAVRAEESWPSALAITAGQIASRLEQTGFRVLSRSGASSCLAWQWRWSWLAVAGAYLGLALGALGLILTSWLGEAIDLTLEPHGNAQLAGPVNLALDTVTVSGDDALHPGGGRLELRALTGVGESQSLGLALHDSRLWRGTWLTAVGVRPVVELAAEDAATGQRVPLQPSVTHTAARELLRLPLTDAPDMRLASVPARNLTVRVDYQAGQGQTDVPAFVVSFYQGKQSSPVQSQPVANGAEVAFDGTRYRVRLDYDAMLEAQVGLWWALAALGWGMVILCMVWLAAAPPVILACRLTAEGAGSRVTCLARGVCDVGLLSGQLLELLAPGAGAAVDR